MLYLVVHLTLAVNPSEMRIYDSLWRYYYSRHSVTEVYKTVKGAVRANKWILYSNTNDSWNYFQQLVLCKFSASIIHSLLLRSMTDIQSVLIIIYCCRKLRRAIPTVQITSTKVVHIFFNDWVMPYEILLVILSNSRQQFITKFSTVACIYLEVKHLTAITFHSKTNIQV